MRILVVDDELNQREALGGFLESLDYEVAMADSAQSALAYLHESSVDAVLTDYKMPYMTGNDLLKEIRQRYPGLVVMIMTAYGTVEAVVEAMKEGAWDFVTKPVDLDLLESHLSDIKNFLGSSRDTTSGMSSDGDFIARSPAVLDLLVKARRVAATNATVMITGDTGTGKEELARFIHANSPRSGENLHVVNCAALPANLVESELFGHVKGAFTGAGHDRIGHFEAADGSTLFLDEIGDLPLDVQVKLLRFLQNSEFSAVGSSELRKTNVRIIAATNVDLKLAVEQGDFREDLLYRLDVIRFHLPPLKERPEDVVQLTKNFLAEFASKYERGNLNISESAMTDLVNYQFPGNVRELRNIIERAAVLAPQSVIEITDLELPQAGQADNQSGGLNESVQKLESELIAAALSEAGGNQSECARQLGISERVLRYKLQKYKLR